MGALADAEVRFLKRRFLVGVRSLGERTQVEVRSLGERTQVEVRLLMCSFLSPLYRAHLPMPKSAF